MTMTSWRLGIQDTQTEREENFRIYPLSRADLIFLFRCPLCDSDDISSLADVYLKSELVFFSTDICNNCLHIFRCIFPSFKWFKKCWKQIFTDQIEINPEIEEMRRHSYEGYYDVLSKYIKKGGCLLDVGAAYGTGTKVFRDAGFLVEAIEAEDSRADYIEQTFQIPVVSHSIESLIWRNHSYDVIILANILEHLDDPQFVISQIKSCLNSDSILYVSIPIFQYLLDWSDALYLPHKNNFSEEDLINLVTGNGFKILERVDFSCPRNRSPESGLVLKFVGNPPISRFKNLYTVHDIQKLYRKNFPLEKVPSLDQTLKYSVPYIEHFYRTVKFDSMDIVDDSEFISFRPKKDIQQ